MVDKKSKDGDDVPLLDPAGPSTFPDAGPPEPYRDDPPAPDAAVPLEGYDDAPPSYSELPAEPLPTNPLAPRRSPPRPAKRIISGQGATGNERFMDARLDSDPGYLVEWMEYLSESPPRAFMRIEGTHTESRTQDSKTKTEEVVDFELKVEMTAFLYGDIKNGKSWRSLRTVRDEEVARRGTSLRTRARGEGGPEVGGGSLVEWAHRYCASSSTLKTFTLRREITGFDSAYVRKRVSELVRETGYKGRVRVHFPVIASRATVYSDCAINELRLTRWVRWLFYLTLLFLLVWPFLFLSTKRFEVLVAEWPFSRVREDGSVEYVSVSEETFVNVWAGAVRRGVVGRRRGVLDQGDIRAAEGSTEFAGERREGVLRTVEGALEVVQRQYGWGHDT